MQGKTINGFELKSLLGRGGMAVVWYAENEIGKPAAVKILNEDLSHNAQIVDRFRNEAVVMVKLDHPNIRQVYGYGTIDGCPCIIMEYLEGDDLKARMKRGQRFTQEELERWWNQLVSALNYTHAQGIVHRDIKPSNIFIDKKGDVKLLDFGIAKVRESISMTQTGAMMGTLMYMSPEQVQDSKHLDYRSDVYSLAVSYVHLLTGKAPYDSNTSNDFAIRKGIVEQELDLSAVPTAWRAFLKPYLAKESSERPALRAFEAVPQMPLADEDEGTIVEDISKNSSPETPKPAPKETHSGRLPMGVSEGRGIESPLSPTPKDTIPPKPKSRKVLWITLAVAIVAIAIVLLAWPKKTYWSIGESIGDSERIMRVTIGENPGVEFQLNYIEGGTFQMGSDDSEADSDEKPAHSVTVGSFYMAETEVTQALWKAVMGSNPSKWQGDNLPVEMVSWNDVQMFIRKLKKITGRDFRLPTEAEWEYAARGGKSNGYIFAGSNIIDSVAWYEGNSGDRTHEVKMKSPNEIRLYDMTGNVWEWCSDWYDDNYYSNSPSTNPRGPANGSSRVLRGGSWFDLAGHSNVLDRYSNYPGIVHDYYGFRLAFSK